MDIFNSYDKVFLEKKFYKLQFLNQKYAILDLETIKEISSLLPWQYSIYEIIDIFSDPNIRSFARNISNLIQIERVNTQVHRITEENIFLKSYEKLEEFAFLFSSMGDLSLNFYNFKNEFDRITIRVLELFEINKKFLNDRIKLQLLIHTLCKEEGLKGLESAYSSVDSIFISQVMKKKIGVPISLSIIYLIVAYRLQLPIYGMNLPLHFILFYHSRDYQNYFDPYHNGVFLDKSVCIKFLESNGYVPKEEYFAKSSIISIIKRLYQNMIFLFRKYRKEPEKDALIYQLNLIENQKIKMELIEIAKKIQTKYTSIIQNNLILEEFEDDLFPLNGKKIRSYFHFLFSQVLDYKGEEWEDIGAVLEIVHTASLLHDDVLDEANFRRGILSFNNKWGNKTAILMGDFLLACGLKHLSSLNNNRLIVSFSKAIQQLSINEILQNKYIKNSDIKFNDYLMIIEGKTGSLFGTASETASILSNCSEKEIQKCYNLGTKLGLFFQIRDDYLDYFSSYEENGKSVLKDFQNGIYTYPVFSLMEKATQSEIQKVHSLFQKEIKKQQDSQIILDLLDKYQVQKIMKQKLNSLLTKFCHFFDDYPESDAKKLIIEQVSNLIPTSPSFN